MAANKRIFWAVQAIALTDHGAGGAKSGDWTILSGVQSIGITTTFNLEQVFEVGQIALYENIEEVPDIEVTIERVLDGRILAYAAASPSSFAHTTGLGAGVTAGANDRRDVYLGIWSDTRDEAGGQNAVSVVYCSGMYLSSISYTLPVDGNCTESISLVGNDKVWNDTDPDDFAGASEGGSFGSGALQFGNDDASVDASGVQRRQDIDWDNSYLPNSIAEVRGTANGTLGNNLAGGVPKAHVQSISISTDLGREAISELGRKTPYHRFVTFPIEVSLDVEVVTTSGDFVDARGEGLSSLGGDNTTTSSGVFKLSDGTTFDLGSKLRLSSVSYGGGDAGGGNATVTYSYSTFNELTVNTPTKKLGGAAYRTS